MNDTATSKGAAAKSVVAPGEQIVCVPVKEIHADFEWNSRSGDWWKPVDPDEKTGDAYYPGLRASILEAGQNNEACVVRQPKTAGGKYRLVTGFRRYRAVQELSDAAKGQGPTTAQKGLLRVVIREMTDKEAELLNVEENTARDNLSGPDLCAAVGRLVNTHKVSDSSLALRISKSQPYVSKLHRIYDSLSPKVLEMWRAGAIRVTIDEIENQVLKRGKEASGHEEQQENYERLVAGKQDKTGGRGPDGWIESKQAEAKDLGKTLQTLRAAGLISITENDPLVICFTAIKMPAKYGKVDPAKKAKIDKSIGAAFASGVEAAMAAEGDEDDDEDEDDSPRKGKK